MLPGNRASCPRRPWIIRIDALDRRKNFLHRAETKKPLPGGKNRAESRLLSDHRAARGKIRGSAIGKPSRSQPDILILGDRKLPPGSPDVIAIRIDARRNA